MDQATLDWLMGIRRGAGGFLASMMGSKAGYYRYSFSGDRFDESRHWNLGSSSFALKIMYTLGREIDEEVRAASRYALSFLRPDGQFCDEFVLRAALPGRIRNAVRGLSLAPLASAPYLRAETRQCYSALRLFGLLPEGAGTAFPRTVDKIERFLSALDWTRPWDAGSHFSHLLFFLRLARDTGQLPDDEYRALTAFCLEWVSGLQNPADGFWYRGQTSENQKINGAMKVITGFETIGNVAFRHAEKISDFCLKQKHAGHACDNLNIVLVLKSAQRQLGNYRGSDVEEFAINRLALFKTHYHDGHGGFSFFPRRSNEVYYGARIARGLEEPDIHGTVLLLWGISMLSKLLRMEEMVGLKEFET